MMPISYPRPLVLVGLLLGCTILALYVGLLLHISIVYTHLFYIPIVLGGLWYPRKALLPALYLGILHLGVEYIGMDSLGFSVIVRAGSFLLVAGVVGLISGRIQRGDRTSLQYMSSYAERVSTPRIKILSTFDGVRMSLGMNMDVERMREHEDVAGLIRTLDHQNAEVRYQAVDALGTLHHPATIERLTQALKDPDCGVRWKAAEALAKFGGDALPLLLQALQDPAADVRWRAALALGDTGKEEAIPALIEALTDLDPYVKGRAIVALSAFGAVAIPHLSRAMDEGDPRIKSGVMRVLGLMGDMGLTMLNRILQERTVEKQILTSLEEAFFDLGKRSIPVMENLLVSAEDPALRTLACRVLGRLGDVQGLEPLVHTRYSDFDERVRNEAEAAMKRLTAIAERISK
jgi:HEAT repeat protein